VFGVTVVGICGVTGFVWVIRCLGMCGQKGDLVVVGKREVDDDGRFGGSVVAI
jgi:hypothetical protein